MPGVFISYRKSDSAGFTGRLFDHLSRHFGAGQVFMDVEGGIARGADFPAVIEGAVAQADAMVVVIGPEWLDCTDKRGNRRLDDPADWVRMEVAAALRREILVLPVLVDGAAMPSAGQLPSDIARLAHKQASEISVSRWRYDVGELIRTLEVVVRPAAATAPRRTRRGLVAALAVLGLAGAGAGAWYLATGAEPGPSGAVEAGSNATGAVPESASTAAVLTPPPAAVPPAPPAAPERDAADLSGDWRDDDNALYRIVKEGEGYQMGRIDPPETDGVYRNITVEGRDIQIDIGALPSGTQYAVAKLQRSIDGNVMSGTVQSTQVEDIPQHWVLRRASAGAPQR
ncbi:MAG TPA: toll/interleukin-1 receptor domain-containing protein [Longimicrobium sp.]|nr:toll/interleukin-1 receptor domain-containing protein [Longimicrobium sp.]